MRNLQHQSTWNGRIYEECHNAGQSTYNDSISLSAQAGSKEGVDTPVRGSNISYPTQTLHFERSERSSRKDEIHKLDSNTTNSAQPRREYEEVYHIDPSHTHLSPDFT